MEKRIFMGHCIMGCDAVPRKNNAKVSNADFARWFLSILKMGAALDSLSLSSLSKTWNQGLQEELFTTGPSNIRSLPWKLIWVKSDYKRQLAYLLKADMVNQALKSGKKINNKSLHFAIKQNVGGRKNSESEDISEDNRIVIVRAEDADQTL